MTLEPYLAEDDEKYLSYWLTLRNLDTSVLKELPAIGYVASDQGCLIAAGFLRRCEGNHAILDSFITSPNASPEARNEAMDLLTAKLIQIAKDHEIKQLVAFTTDSNTHTRGINHGMSTTSYRVMVMSLNPQKAG